MRRSLLATTLAALLACPLALAGDGPPAAFAKGAKQELHQLKQALAQQTAAYAGALETLGEDLSGGELGPAQVHTQLALRIANLQGQTTSALASFSDALTTLASATLDSLAVLPTAFVVGDGGAIDDLDRKARQLVRRAGLRRAKLTARLVKGIEKNTLYDLVLDARGPTLPPMTPVAGGAPVPASHVPLRLDLAVGGGRRPVAADGLLFLGGSADPDAAATVEVTIVRPGDAPRVTTVDVAADGGRWLARFPEEGAGDLPEGNYVIEVRQAGVSLSDSIGVR